MEISYTRYRVYRECPWKYKLHFVDGRKIPLDPKSSFGLSLHRTLERWLRGGERDLDSLHACLRAEWLAQGYPDEAAESRWYAKAERVLSAFHDAEADRRARTVAVEKEFVWPLGPHTVRGMIDRVDQGPDGAYELIDYKTGQGVPTAAEVAGDPQLRFYALGAERGLRLKPATLTVDCVTVGERVSAPYDDSGAAALEADVRAAASGIEAGVFSPDTSFCKRCAFRRDCAHSVER